VITTAPARRLGTATAALAVIASMIGTGVFTTTGVLVRELSSAGAVLAAWALYGVVALAGALCYAELSSALAVNGGEYALLSRIYHPAVGFAAGAVSLVVGFAAPVAACALGFGGYVHAVFPQLPVVPLALALIVAASVLHGHHMQRGALAQNVVTALKVLLVVAFALAGGVVVLRDGAPALAEPARVPFVEAVLSPPFAAGLVLVSFAYSGWNAAAYIAGELRDPGRTIPRAIVLGTLVVTLLYVALNAVFLAAVPATQLSGVVEVGHLAATALFGPRAGAAVSLLIAAGLVSTVGALIMTGARASEAMGHDHARLALLARRTAHGAPIVSVALQAVLASALVLAATFDTLLVWTGLTLTISAALTVGGVIILRRREPSLARPYRVPLYPLAPLLFLAFAAWSLIASVIEQPLIVLASAATIAIALALYGVVRDGRTAR